MRSLWLAHCFGMQVETLYLKPVQTGFPQDSDAALVARVSGGCASAACHASALLPGGGAGRFASSGGSGVLARTLFAWREAVSPHLAVQREGHGVGDRELVAALAAEVASFAASGLPEPSASSSSASSPSGTRRRLVLVETAGGVASPGPSGTLQADLLRPLRLPSLLVGDGRLGGISATLSSLDSLLLRGYDVPMVVLMDESGANTAAVQQHVGAHVRVLPFPRCLEPPPLRAPATAGWAAGSEQQQQQQQQPDPNLQAWLDECAPQFDELLLAVQQAHEHRLEALHAAAAESRRILWWPFTQHGNVAGNEAVTVIDARAGERFAVFRPGGGNAAGSSTASIATGSGGAGAAGAGTSALQLQYDACASWWTQGLSAAAQPRLVAAVARAAGRYGHVMYPENAHEPALALARALLASVGVGWAARVFFSDNGSTAVEVRCLRLAPGLQGTGGGGGTLGSMCSPAGREARGWAAPRHIHR